MDKKISKPLKLWAGLAIAILTATVLAGCGDSTATPVPATTAATTTVAATTAAATAATTTSAATTSSAAATTAAATTAASATAVANGQTIRIYSSLPLTGSSKAQNDTLVDAMKLALDQESNGTGIVAGFKIDYVPLDDATAAAGQWDPQQEAANANKAINDPDAMLYLGTFNSGAAQVSIPLLNKVGMVMVSPANTYLGLTKSFPGISAADEPDKYFPNSPRNYFRVVALDDIQGSADANYLASTLKVKKVYIIDDGQSYGVGLAKGFEYFAGKAGLSVLAHDSITGKESDYKSLANKIKSAAPEAIFFGGISQQQAGKLLADIRSASVKAVWLSGDGTKDDAFLKDAGSAGEGAFVSVTGVRDEDLPQKGKDFLKTYKAKYGDNIQAYTIKGYDAMGVALDAIKRAGKKDRAAILQAVANTKDYNGAQGTFSFDKNGDATLTTFSIYKISDGAWSWVTNATALAAS